jgi:hypothetical protein
MNALEQARRGFDAQDVRNYTFTKRFIAFNRAMRDKLGMNAQLLANQVVIVKRTEFSPEKQFPSLQSAIDTFARFMTSDLLS